MSICKRCGSEFSCGMADGKSDGPCWCTQFPPLPATLRDPSPDASCYCPDCLKVLTEAPAEATPKT